MTLNKLAMITLKRYKNSGIVSYVVSPAYRKDGELYEHPHEINKRNYLRIMRAMKRFGAKRERERYDSENSFIMYWMMYE